MKVVLVQTKREKRQFIDFPYELYKDNLYWVPPLKAAQYRFFFSSKNPSLKLCKAAFWLAIDGKRVVGRVAGIIHHLANKKINARKCRFGWIDFVDDVAVSKALLVAVETWARDHGLDEIHGPLGFTDFDPQGTLIDGFDEISNMNTIYNFSYYAAHFQKLGFVKEVDWAEYKFSFLQAVPAVIEKVAHRALKHSDCRVVYLKSKQDFMHYVDDIFDLLNRTYKDLHAFVPFSKAQAMFYVNEFKDILDPLFIPLIVDHSQRVVAFGFAFPGLAAALQRTRGRLFPFGFLRLLYECCSYKTLELGLIAVDAAYRSTGLAAVLLHEGFKHAQTKGLEWSYCNPQLETNSNVQGLWKVFNGVQHKKRRCYTKQL